ncbi:MAG TPA: endonuclease/exonuclease/phosphatase family protein [Puia sp.]|nr:endonuclease/exonuclease/phosphatase family protein [Puia sp.]
MAILRNLTRRIFIIVNVIVVFLFLLACTNPFLHPNTWWFISLLGLIFPLLLVLLILFLLFWLFFAKRHWAILSLITLIIGWQNIHAFFAFNMLSSFNHQKADSALRVITWNVRRFDEFTSRKPGDHRIKMLDFLKEQNGDVLCLQEFFESHNAKEFATNIPFIQKELNYPYYFFSYDYRRYDDMYESGVIIFSKFPITDSLQIHYKTKDNIKATESLIGVDLNVNGKTVRVFTTHLQSVLFSNKEFRDLEIIKNVQDSTIEASKSIVKKLKRAYGFRGGQADIVRQQLDKSPFPAIICGDFNDVPNSYTYFHIRGDLQDAFIKKGFGVGRSYVHISPTLRIDYIFADKKFTVLQSEKFNLPYSDHHPVIADLQLPSKTE